MNNFPAHINTFSGGLDKDTSVNKYSNTHYQHAENFRILTENGLTSGALQTVDGTILLFNIPANYYYHGHCFIRDYIVLFLRHTGAADKIYYFPLDNPTIAANVLDTGYCVYTDDLNFQANYLVQAEGRYESSTIQKVYWVDGYNPIRFINLVETGIDAKPSDYLSVLPLMAQQPITISSITNDGSLNIGLIQYSTLFYSSSGAESVFSQPIEQIQLTRGTLISDWSSIYSSDSMSSSGKSVSISITNPDSTVFNKVRVISIHYQEYGSNPKITIIGDYSITTTLIVKDSGNSVIGEYTIEEFNRLKNIFKARTLSTKNNYLFAADIEDIFEEIDYDARAYRFTQYATSYTGGVATSLLKDTSGDIEIISTDIAGDPDHWGVTDDHDAINPYTDLTPDSSGTTIVETDYDFRIKYDELLTTWTNSTYDTTFATTGTNPKRTDIVTGTSGLGISNNITLEKGDVITLEVWYAKTSGEFPTIKLFNGVTQVGTSLVLAAGANILSYLIEDDAVHHFEISNTAAANFYIYGYHNRYVYQLGGDGPNISYKFKVDTFVEDQVVDANDSDVNPTYTFEQGYKGPDLNSSDAFMKSTHDNYLSPFRRINSLSFRRDEIYRVGVEWVDAYARPLFVNWIGDIRFPTNIDANYKYSFVTVDHSANKLYMHPLTLRVDVTITQELIDKGVSGFRIVRCERNNENKTILDSGLVGSLQEHYTIADSFMFPYEQVTSELGQAYAAAGFIDTFGGDGADGNAGDGVSDGVDATGMTLGTLSNSYKEYTSAEVNFNKNNISLDGTYLVPMYNMDAYYSFLTFSSSAVVDKVVGKKYSILTQNATISAGRFAISDTSLFSDTTYNAVSDLTAYYKTVNNSRVYNYSLGSRSHGSNAEARGTCLLFYGTESGDPYDVSKTYQAIYSNRKRNIQQYGGNTYEDRMNSIYIGCSPYYDISTKVANEIVSAEATGDTYLCMHEHLRTMAPSVDPAKSCIEVMLFPTESSYNCSLRSNNTISKNYNLLGLYEATSITNVHEVPGVYSKTQVTKDYMQTYDYYEYNKIFNSEDTIKQFIPEPLDYYLNKNIRNDVKVVASEKKFNNEYIDSWTKFYFANEIELDTKYGAISKLINFNNSLMSFQKKSIAILAVEEKEVAQTNTPTALAIGYSGILSRYDYLSTENGTSQLKAIIQTPNQLMWYDDTNNGIYNIKSLGEPSITKIQGMSSWFNTSFSGTAIPTLCTTGYDRKFNEVLFQFYLAPSYYTLVYNEITNSFVSLYSLPLITNFIFSNSKLLGISGSAVHTHNTSAISLYGTYPIAKLTMVIKPRDPGTIRFDSLEWDSLSETSNVEVADKTFDKIRCYNSYQDSTLITTPDFKRRFRQWRYNTLRDSVAVGARLRDSYLQVDFQYQTIANNKFLLHDIKTHYLPNKS